jgi:hypothetical protein
VAYYDSAHAQISAGQARASPADYQGRRLPCWLREVVAQLFFKASNKVKKINLLKSHRDYFSSYVANTMLAFIYKKISLSF